MEKILLNQGKELKKLIQDLQNSFSFNENFPNVNKKTLRYYNFEDVYLNALEFFENIDTSLNILLEYLNNNLSKDIEYTYRFKTKSSLKAKWEKNLQFGKKFYKACNDLLGIRFIMNCSERELLEKIKIFYDDKNCKIIDFYEKNKTKDDGYRGVHIYFRFNKNSFPIEFQFWTRKDALLHFYTHEVIYKSKDKEKYLEYSNKLRKWFDDIPETPKGIEIDYINYLYSILNK